MSSISVRKMFVAAGVAMLAAGCTGAGGSASRPAPSFDGSSTEGVLTVTVDNQQLNEARITLWIDGSRRRLGSVRANSRETFRVPLDHIATVRMEFDLTLGDNCVTADVQLGPGEDILATIPTNLRYMAAVCRR